MQNKLVWKLFLWLAVAALAAPAALAQCVSNVPAEILIGQSACIQVCADEFAYPAIQLVGNVHGPQGYPVIVLTAGCSAVNTDCDLACSPVEPPSAFVFGGDPFYPNNYYAENDCFMIYLYWVHDNVWALEIYTLCSGCFCLSFDDQLPVELRSDFTALAGNDRVVLNWATASETNNDRFEILRDDATVAALPSQGSGAAGYEYNWTDAGVANGTTYRYSLVSVDGNGSRHNLGTASATPAHPASVVTDYALGQNFPNPFNPSTRISFDVVEPAFVTLKVFNPMGEEVQTLIRGHVGAGQHAVQFDAESLPTGLYFYSITIGDRFSATRKMLLVK